MRRRTADEEGRVGMYVSMMRADAMIATERVE